MREKSKSAVSKGIVWNARTGLYEVYGLELILRRGERVPNYEAESFAEAVTYALEVEGWR